MSNSLGALNLFQKAARLAQLLVCRAGVETGKQIVVNRGWERRFETFWRRRSAEPRRTLDNNPAFLLKMAMLAIAIAMTLAFQYSLARNASLWEKSASERKAIGVLAILTFVIWLIVAMAGRWIAYVREG